jgi:hypothetical protein
MNESYFQSVIADRNKEVSKVVKDNQIYNNLKDFASSENSSPSVKNDLSLSISMIGKRFIDLLLSRIRTA